MDARERKVAADSQPWANLNATNSYEDNRELPACVTWFDAIAYCKHLERSLDRPVRLLKTEEWRRIRPSQDLVNTARDFSCEFGVEQVPGLSRGGYRLRLHQLEAFP